MKLAVFVLFLAAVSAAVYAMDLDAAAKREKERRQSLEGRRSGPRTSFTDDDLARYRRDGAEIAPVRKRGTRSSARDSDFEKQRELWEREARRHERELDRLDASIRRLEWRLSERRSRRPAGERLSKDPVIEVLEDSLESLREERKRIDERFRERARRAGALPGWLR